MLTMIEGKIMSHEKDQWGNMLVNVLVEVEGSMDLAKLRVEPGDLHKFPVGQVLRAGCRIQAYKGNLYVRPLNGSVPKVSEKKA